MDAAAVRFVVPDVSCRGAELCEGVERVAAHAAPADDFIDELATDGIELVLANPSQQVGAA